MSRDKTFGIGVGIAIGIIVALGLSLYSNSLSGTSDDFDFSTLRSASADSTNSLYLKVNGIPGSSTNSLHKDQIVLLWYCFGYSSRSDTPGCNADEGKSRFATNSFDGFHFIMADNKATPKLMKAYLNKTTIDKVTFSVQRGSSISGGSDYLVVTFSDVKLTSYFHASNEEYKMPVVESSFNYSKIEMTYKEAGQMVKEGGDFTTNKPI